MTELILRLSLLLLMASLAGFVLRRAEPSWRLTVFRAGFLAVALLAVTALIRPSWNWPVLVSDTTSTAAVAAAPVMESPVASPLPPDPAGRISVVTPEPGNALSLPRILTALWIVVALLLLARQLLTQCRLSAEARSFAPASPELQNLWSEVCGEFGVPPTRVRISPDNVSPCLGPQGDLLLPAEAADREIAAEALRHVLRHEAAHLAARDHIWLPATAALTRVLWFHPLAWWLNASHLRACEETRDAEAARAGGAAPYRSTLAGLALRWLPVHGTAAGLFRKESDLLRRLQRVNRTANQKPASPASRFSLGALTLATGLIFGGVILVPHRGLADEDNLLGLWRSTDPNTRFVKELEVLETDDSIIVRLWQSVGGKIDSSPRLIEFPHWEAVSSGISKDFGFKVQTYAMEGTPGGLTLRTTTKYTDDSGRRDRDDKWTFVRATRKAAVMGTVERAGQEGWEGFWRNQDRGSQGSLQLEIGRAPGETLAMSVWGRLGGEISREPVSRAVLTSSGNTATGKADHGFAVRTYTLTMQENGLVKVRVETDFTDPKRHDHDYLWLFERGKY